MSADGSTIDFKKISNISCILLEKEKSKTPSLITKSFVLLIPRYVLAVLYFVFIRHELDCPRGGTEPTVFPNKDKAAP